MVPRFSIVLNSIPSPNFLNAAFYYNSTLKEICNQIRRQSSIRKNPELQILIPRFSIVLNSIPPPILSSMILWRQINLALGRFCIRVWKMKSIILKTRPHCVVRPVVARKGLLAWSLKHSPVRLESCWPRDPGEGWGKINVIKSRSRSCSQSSFPEIYLNEIVRNQLTDH